MAPIVCSSPHQTGRNLGGSIWHNWPDGRAVTQTWKQIFPSFELNDKMLKLVITVVCLSLKLRSWTDTVFLVRQRIHWTTGAVTLGRSATRQLLKCGLEIGCARGNPRVFLSNPYPYPLKPLPPSRVRVFKGKGKGYGGLKGWKGVAQVSRGNAGARAFLLRSVVLQYIGPAPLGSPFLTSTTTTTTCRFTFHLPLGLSPPFPLPLKSRHHIVHGSDVLKTRSDNIALCSSSLFLCAFLFALPVSSPACLPTCLSPCLPVSLPAHLPCQHLLPCTCAVPAVSCHPLLVPVPKAASHTIPHLTSSLTPMPSLLSPATPFLSRFLRPRLTLSLLSLLPHLSCASHPVPYQHHLKFVCLSVFINISHTSDETQLKHFQSLIRSLMYIQIGTCPDISFAVLRLAQYAANPSSQHLRLAQYTVTPKTIAMFWFLWVCVKLHMIG